MRSHTPAVSVKGSLGSVSWPRLAPSCIHSSSHLLYRPFRTVSGRPGLSGHSVHCCQPLTPPLLRHLTLHSKMMKLQFQGKRPIYLHVLISSFLRTAGQTGGSPASQMTPEHSYGTLTQPPPTANPFGPLPRPSSIFLGWNRETSRDCQQILATRLNLVQSG